MNTIAVRLFHTGEGQHERNAIAWWREGLFIRNESVRVDFTLYENNLLIPSTNENRLDGKVSNVGMIDRTLCNS